jgi:hypothetical protein
MAAARLIWSQSDEKGAASLSVARQRREAFRLDTPHPTRPPTLQEQAYGDRPTHEPCSSDPTESRSAAMMRRSTCTSSRRCDRVEAAGPRHDHPANGHTADHEHDARDRDQPVPLAPLLHHARDPCRRVGRPSGRQCARERRNTTVTLNPGAGVEAKAIIAGNSQNFSAAMNGTVGLTSPANQYSGVTGPTGTSHVKRSDSGDITGSATCGFSWGAGSNTQRVVVGSAWKEGAAIATPRSRAYVLATLPSGLLLA